MDDEIISAISSDPSIHRTTFRFLDKHALENVKDAYEALPSHTTLHFEYMYKNNMQHIASDNADVLPIRLILGYLKSSRKRSKSAVYAYIRKQDQLSKMFLRLAGVHLTVAILDHLEFEAPFDLIYDTYAMTERAISGLCTMAAHYFLAAGHVPAIVTRSDYRKSFVTLCAKIQPLQHVGGAWDSGDGTATGAPNSPPCAPKEPGNVGAVESDQANRQTSSEEDASTAVECEIEATGREMAQSGCDAIIATRAIPVKLSVDIHNQIESRGKTPDLEDFISFLSAYKTFRANYAALAADNEEVKSTRTRLSQSQSGEREAVNVPQQTQAELNTMTARTADLQKQLQEVSAKEEDATKKMVAMRYTLGLQKVKTASAKFSLQEAEKKAQDLTAEMEDLKRANEAMAQQLKDAVSHKDMKRVVQAVNTEKESLIGENTRLKDQVKTLEVEVQDTKDRFMAYQAKIRAMTM